MTEPLNAWSYPHRYMLGMDNVDMHIDDSIYRDWKLRNNMVRDLDRILTAVGNIERLRKKRRTWTRA